MSTPKRILNEGTQSIRTASTQFRRSDGRDVLCRERSESEDDDDAGQGICHVPV